MSNITAENVEDALKAYFGPTFYAIARNAAAPKRAMRAALETLPPPDLPWRISDIQRGLILFRTSNNAHSCINYEALTFKIMALPKADRDELAALLRAVAASLEAKAPSSSKEDGNAR